MLEASELAVVLVGHCGDDAQFGRTSLQKLAYLCEAEFGWSSAGYRAYYYGPYSRDIDRAVNELVREGVIDEDVEHLGFAGTQGFAAKRYRYALTDTGRTLLNGVERDAPADVVRVRGYADRVRKAAGGYDQRILSLAAKTHYIVRTAARPVDFREISANAHQLGWRISEPQIRRVTSLLEALELVTTSRQ